MSTGGFIGHSKVPFLIKSDKKMHVNWYSSCLVFPMSFSGFPHGFITSFLNRPLNLSLYLNCPAPPPPHSLHPRHAAACVVVLKSVASSAWLAHKPSFSVSDTQLMHPALNTLVLTAKKTRPNEAVGHFWEFSCFSGWTGDCGMLLWLHTVPEDALTLRVWLQTSDET